MNTQTPSLPAGRMLLCFWCCIVCLAAPAAAGDAPATQPAVSQPSSQPTADVGPLFHEADKQFKSMKSTRYQHKTVVDPARQSYQYDCVGFVSYALKQATPQARESAFKTLNIKPGYIPTPGKYVTFFLSLTDQPQPGWERVVKASDLRPGDVVAWEQKTRTSNGHAVIIASVPAAGPDDTWVVTIYDSTAAPHAEDSRKTDERAEPVTEGGRPSGLGRGVMAFTADPRTGVLTGYRWSPKAKSYTVPIAAGRARS